MQNVLIETDSQVLTQAVKSKFPIAEILPILQDIWVLLATIPRAGFTWIPWEGNKLAHELQSKRRISCNRDKLAIYSRRCIEHPFQQSGDHSEPRNLSQPGTPSNKVSVLQVLEVGLKLICRAYSDQDHEVFKFR
ncbi:hypothetical protein PIB30_027295 [Stylosanthes scabra]|uniref:RNase H type-1 domain-containing protein n=1 Tax=Stylosanthes scabra TaxID=79078 RepID=A0ABU6Y9C6_9FABA|nr:hypothetical protein [Stylosanthes scabra]